MRRFLALCLLALLSFPASAQAPTLTVGRILNTSAVTVAFDILPFALVDGEIVTGTTHSFVVPPGSLVGPFVIACDGAGEEPEMFANATSVQGLAPCGESFSITIWQGNGTLVAN